MVLFKTIFYGIWGGFLRRWFGGALEKYKILGNRGVQTFFMLLTFLSIYVTGNVDESGKYEVETVLDKFSNKEFA